MTEEAPRRNPLMEEAAMWFARMRGPEAEEHRADFEAWLARGALHRSAYNRAGEIFSLGKFLDDGAQPPDSVPDETPDAGEESPVRYGVDRKRVPLLPLLLVAACIMFVIGWGVLARPVGDPLRAGRSVADGNARLDPVKLATGRGEVQQHKLSDGTSVHLDPDSILVVAFDDLHRKLVLERGAARFDVAHEKRPFVVFAGGGSVTARGTIFEVRIAPDHRVTVRLVRGIVEVAMPPSRDAGGATARLEAGQAVTFAPAASAAPDATPASTPPPSASPPPVAALREFDGARLDDVLSQVNGLNRVQIRLVDPMLGARPVSGRFRVNDPDKMAERLAWIFGLHVERTASGDLTLSAR